jgi:hypothetical protein
MLRANITLVKSFFMRSRYNSEAACGIGSDEIAETIVEPKADEDTNTPSILT